MPALAMGDGTLLKGLPAMAWALWLNEDNRAAKAHVQFELFNGVPIDAVITDANASETDVLSMVLQAGRIYVTDRGYAKYSFLQEILDADSSFVCRLQDSAVFEVIEERELSKEALDAGVVRDAVVRLGSKPKRDDLRAPVRIVEVECRPHHKPSGKTGRGGPEQGDTILRSSGSSGDTILNCLSLSALALDRAFVDAAVGRATAPIAR